MTNSQKTQRIQQYDELNYGRIKSLASGGMDGDEAERIDELDTVQTELLDRNEHISPIAFFLVIAVHLVPETALTHGGPA